ncbi:MAG: DUF1186 domain-containing protein [Pirellulaceae bacterium]
MTGNTASIIERLCQAERPHRLRDWEKKDDYYVETCRVSREDASPLIYIASKWLDTDWEMNNSARCEGRHDVYWLPVTAWRTLAELRASECVEPLLDMVCHLDVEYDDCCSLELPHVFGKIGKPAIGALVHVARDVNQRDFVRSIATDGLWRVAEYHPETRDDVVPVLTELMTNAADNSVEFNSTLLVSLVELVAVEAAEAIERAFANNLIDVGMMGDWEKVRRRLGVEGLKLEMPERPYNSVERLRSAMGIGIFSEDPIFDRGECIGDAEEAYVERACTLFSKSNEAKQVIDRFGGLPWVQILLEFGTQYRGEIVDNMTTLSVEEFVFGHVPRKVSVEPEAAASLVFELAMFWRYVDRVYELPQARSIAEWLEADEIVETLETELSEPANFGMAKSLVMAGEEAGYDMTSKEDVDAFVKRYNQSLQAGAASHPDSVSTPATTITRQEKKVGRNDPCPCGSGKKFKKCCRRK